MPNQILTIRGSTFSACNRMWRGIQVQETGQLFIDNSSTISDAEFAVYAVNWSAVTCNNVTFSNNYCGLYIPVSGVDATYVAGSMTNTTFTSTPGTLKGPYPGQANVPPSSRSYAGIIMGDDAYNPSGISTTNPNIFSNLNLGIKSTGPYLSIANCKFDNIKVPPSPEIYEGAAIVHTRPARGLPALQVTGLGKTSTTPTFNNCDIGIYAKDGLYVDDCKFTSIGQTGIISSFTLYNDVVIENNYIESKHNGIVISQCDGVNFMEIKYNDIVIGQSSPGTHNAGIVVANVNKSFPSYISIFENKIDLYNNYFTGIWLLNTNGATVQENEVQHHNNSYVGLPNPAIKIDNSEAPNINCNVINGDANITTMFTDNISIESNMTLNGKYGCNSTNNTGRGFLFHGSCDNSNFTGNNMHDHSVGVEISNTGVIGLQPVSGSNKGNEWLGSYSGWGFQNLNTVNAFLSLFNYDDDNNTHPEYYPGTVDPQSSFNPVSNTTEEDCATTTGCEAQRVGCDKIIITAYDLQVAHDYVETGLWAEETRWIAERNLYNKLLRCPDLLNENGMQDFFDKFNLFDSQRFLTELEIRLNTVYELDSINDSLLQAYTAMYELLYTELADLNTQYAEALASDNKPEIERLLPLILAKQQQLAQLSLMITEVMEAIDQNHQMTIEEIAVDNLAATFSHIYETNSQDVNDLYLISLETELNSSEIALLQSIANQCPYTGGPAVYQARAILMEIFGPVSYDDEQNCLEDSIIWRKSENEIKYHLTVEPNPANVSATFKYNLPSDAKALIEIYNSIGSVVSSLDVEENSKQTTLDISPLNNGIYYFKLRTESVIIGQGKLSILK